MGRPQVSGGMAEGRSQGDSEPSGFGLHDRLVDILDDVADGAFRSVTAYDGSTPLLSLVPYRQRIPDAGLPAAADVPLRLSRFAYVHRAEREIRIETPLSEAYGVVHDPRAGAIVAALAFDATPRALAERVGLPLDVTASVLGLLQSLRVVNPIAQPRPLGDRLRTALEVSAEVVGIAVDPEVERQLELLLADRIGDTFELLWELHLDGSGRTDVSYLEHRKGRDESGILKDFSFSEFDLVDGELRLMGRFDMVKAPPPGEDPAEFLSRIGRQCGVGIELSTHAQLVALVGVLDLPVSVGVTSGRAERVRMLLPVMSTDALDAACAVLADAGVDPSVVTRLPLLAPLIGGLPFARLAIDVTADGIGPRLGLEVFCPTAWPRIPGVLDALGVSPETVARFSDLGALHRVTGDVADARGVISDAVSVEPLHAKIVFDGPVVSVKGYVSVLTVSDAIPGRTHEDRVIPPTWEFHDLLFHSQTRNGRVRRRLGGTARFQVFPDTSGIGDRTPFPGDIILPPVDLAQVAANDPPFGEVMHRRLSVRDWGAGTMPLKTLAELLARVTEVRPLAMPEGMGPDVAFDRAYPSGGGIYETDLVILANRVEGLETGAYLHRPGPRSLGPLPTSIAKFQGLLIAAGEATGQGMATPEVLIVCAARFQDLAVKYEGIAYALMLKHVGVLMEAINLTATAMGLGACALGNGDADDFAAATGLDYYRHGSIGEVAVSLLP